MLSFEILSIYGKIKVKKQGIEKSIENSRKNRIRKVKCFSNFLVKISKLNNSDKLTRSACQPLDRGFSDKFTKKIYFDKYQRLNFIPLTTKRIQCLKKIQVSLKEIQV